MYINKDELLRKLSELRTFEEDQGIYRNEITYTDVIDVINQMTEEESAFVIV